MGSGGIFCQSRSVGKSRPVFCIARFADSPSSADFARDSFQRTASNRRPRRTAPPACSGEARPEESEGCYEAFICVGRAERLLGRAWILTLRRNLMPFQDEPLQRTQVASKRAG